MKCFACDKPTGPAPQLVTCMDDQTVHVGSDCYRRIKSAGAMGYQPPKGGPRLYLLQYKGCDCQSPPPVTSGAAGVSEDCPIHGYRDVRGS